ncbi:MAG: formylglycine-generating enzyme family protein, partial [Bdellovibrionales bacterium]|nr:formylglycine-generating enzyme family protein [Bdellovibrionales bacterium]
GRTELEKSLLNTYSATDGLNDQFIHVRPTEFTMGSSKAQPNAEANEVPHVIRGLGPFDLQAKELTQAQWVHVMGYNPSEFRRAEDCPLEHVRKNGVEFCTLHPVENVSWNEIQIFLSRLNLIDQTYQYRLPTEVEWEFAARGGTSTAFHFGDAPAELHKYGWWYKNSNNKSQSVGLKRPNPYGFYDMHGNVWEWTGDWYRPYSATESNQKFRTIRGGSWFSDHPNLRSANRGNAAPTSRVPFIGFRLVRSLKAASSNH